MPVNKIAKAFQSEHGEAALYIGALGAVIASFLPDPTDALFFSLSGKWEIQLKKGEITPEQYWTRISVAYFTLDFIWWLFIFVLALSWRGDVKQKATVVGIFLGMGALIGVIFNNIQKDKEFFSEYQLVPKPTTGS